MTQAEMVLFFIIGVAVLVLWSLKVHSEREEGQRWWIYSKLIYRDKKKKSSKQDSKGDSNAE